MKHAHVARDGASDGQRLYVKAVTADAKLLPAHGARYCHSGMSVMYADTGNAGAGKVGMAPWLQYALRTVEAEA